MTDPTPQRALPSSLPRAAAARSGARVPWLATILLALLVAGCNAPADTTVVFDNEYPVTTGTDALVVYQAFWQAVSLASPVVPGASSEPEDVLSASDNVAYVVLAPGWDPASTTPPSSMIVMESKAGFTLHLGQRLNIPVNDATFLGDCAAGSVLTQAEADFITQRIFPQTFASVTYDAATCQTTPTGDAGAP